MQHVLQLYSKYLCVDLCPLFVSLCCVYVCCVYVCAAHRPVCLFTRGIMGYNGVSVSLRESEEICVLHD